MRKLGLLALAILVGGTAADAQTTWTGAVSTNWNTPGNWSAGVPISTTDATIPAAPANQPSTYSADPVCHGLLILPGATVTLGGGFDLSITGNLDLGGSLTVTSSASTITVTGDWTDTGTFTNGSTTVTFNGTGSVGGSVNTPFPHVVLASGTRTAYSSFSVGGSLTVAPGAAFDIRANTIAVSGDW